MWARCIVSSVFDSPANFLVYRNLSPKVTSPFLHTSGCCSLVHLHLIHARSNVAESMHVQIAKYFQFPPKNIILLHISKFELSRDGWLHFGYLLAISADSYNFHFPYNTSGWFSAAEYTMNLSSSRVNVKLITCKLFPMFVPSPDSFLKTHTILKYLPP